MVLENAAGAADPKPQRTANVCKALSDVDRDAARLNLFLQSGNPEFVVEFTALYGPKGPKGCATRQLVTRLASLDPADVKVGDAGYTIDAWRIMCTTFISDLKNHASISEVNQKVVRDVAPQDHARFMAEFNLRAAVQQLHIRVVESRSTHQLEFQTE